MKALLCKDGVDPRNPLGAQLRSVRLGNASIRGEAEQHSQDAHARMEFTLPRGNTLLTVEYKGRSGGCSFRFAAGDGSLVRRSRLLVQTLRARVLTVGFDFLHRRP